jgi:hypothetical protein
VALSTSLRTSIIMSEMLRPGVSICASRAAVNGLWPRVAVEGHLIGIGGVGDETAGRGIDDGEAATDGGRARRPHRAGQLLRERVVAAGVEEHEARPRGSRSIMADDHLELRRLEAESVSSLSCASTGMR